MRMCSMVVGVGTYPGEIVVGLRLVDTNGDTVTVF